jgi:2-dehydro-3-deoxyphosphooctonate aldolase (KDO 8-P synthase)
MSFILIAGPCVIESRDLALSVAERVKGICYRLGIDYVFKASFDKANRSSGGSFREPGFEDGLAVLGSWEFRCSPTSTRVSRPPSPPRW